MAIIFYPGLLLSLEKSMVPMGLVKTVKTRVEPLVNVYNFGYIQLYVSASEIRSRRSDARGRDVTTSALAGNRTFAISFILCLQPAYLCYILTCIIVRSAP